MYCKIPLEKIKEIKIIFTDCKSTINDVVSKYKCTYVINGGLYDMSTRKPNNIPLRVDGKTYQKGAYNYWCYAWNKGPDISFINSQQMENWNNVIACSAMMKDGKDTSFIYTSAQGGKRGRTAIGRTDTDLVLFATTDNNGAVTPDNLRLKMKSFGCQDAIMLDCGASSQGYFNGSYVRCLSTRKVLYWICIWLTDNKEEIKPQLEPVKEEQKKNPYNVPTNILKKGSKGKGVMWLQWELTRLNYNCGTIDGIFGNKVFEAVKDFQKDNNLSVDGIVGKETRNKLKNK